MLKSCWVLAGRSESGSAPHCNHWILNPTMSEIEYALDCTDPGRYLVEANGELIGWLHRTGDQWLWESIHIDHAYLLNEAIEASGQTVKPLEAWAAAARVIEADRLVRSLMRTDAGNAVRQ